MVPRNRNERGGLITRKERRGSGSITIGGGGDGTRGWVRIPRARRWQDGGRGEEKGFVGGLYGRRPALVIFPRFRPSLA
jgi:hypothetical protein